MNNETIKPQALPAETLVGALPETVEANNVAQELLDSTKVQVQQGTMEKPELHHAAEFARNYGGIAKYCHTHNRWYCWNGKYWKPDSDGTIRRLSMKHVANLVVTKETLREQSRARIDSVINLAKDLSYVSADKLDAGTESLLNCSNGILCLSTGKLHPHDPERMITQYCNIHYDAKATCPEWDKFLNRVFDDNQELIDYVQEAAGYSLTGYTSEQALFLMIGSGANGKSTFVNTMQHLMGAYAETLPMNCLMQSKSDSIPIDLAKLPAKRFVSAQEGEAGQKLAEAKIKEMTGGDKLNARFMRENFFAFTPQFKLWLSTNKLPQIYGSEEGIWRRIRVIPFAVTIPTAERDPELEKKLRAEKQGILAWAVKGARRYFEQHKKLNTPSIVLDATNSYRSDSDMLGQFISDRCIDSQQEKTTVKEFNDAYQEWCLVNGLQPLATNLVSRLMREKGYSSEKLKGVKGNPRGYLGVGLLTEEPRDVEQEMEDYAASPIYDNSDLL